MPKIRSELSRKRTFKSENDLSIRGSCTDEDTSQSVSVNPNKISRWIHMMNSSENINIAFLRVLKEIEDNVTERIDVFQRNLEIKINNTFDTIQNQQPIVFTNTFVKELAHKLGITLPIEDVELFENFDITIENDSDKQEALRKIFLHKIDGITTVTQDIYRLMNYVTTESVQIHYTSAGKKFRGRKKKNFSSTNIYLCMEDALIHKYKQPSTTLQLKIKFSNFFARVNHKNNKLTHDESDSE